MTTAVLEHASAEIAEGSVRSADGTRIGFRRLGSGPALVLVHGSVSTHTDWMRVARLLAGRFNCYAMDRRGRGRSGVETSPYSIEREYEDIVAVLVAAGPGAMLAGHSFGAICALGAALRHPVPRLVLYEPPLPVGGPIAGEHLPAYVHAIAEGDLDTALEIGLLRFTRLNAAAIAEMRSSRAWPRLRALAPSWTRELEAMDSRPASVDRYRAIACPVLLLKGSVSPEHPMQNAARALAQVLPSVRVETLMGQGHMALRGAPEVVARLMLEFLVGG
jgi:pimeloyl-ACP methyl ester carboxylesterase